MRKIALLCAALLLSAVLSGCVNPYQPMPFGVWENSRLGMTLIIDPEYAHDFSGRSGLFSGVYVIDGVATDVYVSIGAGSGEISVRSTIDGTTHLRGEYIAVEPGSNWLQIDLIRGSIFPRRDGGVSFTLVREVEPPTSRIPSGIWHSEEHEITFVIDDEHRFLRYWHRFPGYIRETVKK